LIGSQIIMIISSWTIAHCEISNNILSITRPNGIVTETMSCKDAIYRVSIRRVSIRRVSIRRVSIRRVSIRRVSIRRVSNGVQNVSTIAIHIPHHNFSKTLVKVQTCPKHRKSSQALVFCGYLSERSIFSSLFLSQTR